MTITEPSRSMTAAKAPTAAGVAPKPDTNHAGVPTNVQAWSAFATEPICEPSRFEKGVSGVVCVTTPACDHPEIRPADVTAAEMTTRATDALRITRFLPEPAGFETHTPPV